MEWADEQHVILQHLNRLQNENDVLLGNATSGKVHSVYRDTNDAWLDVVGRVDWIREGRELLWLSEKDGFRHAYAVKRDRSGERLVTRFEGDIIRPLGTDAVGEWFYFLASPHNATESYLYRSALEGETPPERLTPQVPGTHTYDVAPNGEWAFHTHSSFDQPPVVDLVALPEHERVRTLEDNAELRARLDGTLSPPVEMFTLSIEPGVSLDSWILKPADFDPQRSYPLLVYVYGEPAGQTVLNRWFGARTLFHRALANAGFIVASFDNRGTPAPKGAPWRKVVYGAVGDLSSRDQAAAVNRLVERHPYIDRERVAIWGWSGGGSNTLNAMFRFPDVFHVGVSVAAGP